MEGQAEVELCKNYLARRQHEERLERLKAMERLADKEGVNIFTKDQDYLLALMQQKESVDMVRKKQ